MEDAVDPSSVAKRAVEIVEQTEESVFKEACSLHQYCSTEIEYEAFNDFRHAEEVLETKSGDCTDQSILLSSMLLSRGIPVRFVQVQDHIFPEALLKTSPGNISERKVQRLYNISRDTEVWILGDRNRHDSLDDIGYWSLVFS
ncbi:transglutaminase domain-containing protein [Haloferax sp. Q22]|uniref:transglutaminase domain-containing protein n=1 Tax=Haloferax sp. (strain Q22) TaxID=1526048 RepID=UPI00155F426D|nr:transglutaminase domain-containing protein [Haloferax sp. Q22]